MAKAKKLPSGNQRVQATATVNGEKIHWSFTASEKREAEMEALKWQTSHSKDYAKNFTVGQMIEQYINSKTNVLSPSTINDDKTI